MTVHCSLHSFPSSLFCLCSIRTSLLIPALGSFSTDRSVRTFLLRKALWTSLKIFSLLFSTGLLLIRQRPRWCADRLALGFRGNLLWPFLVLLVIGFLKLNPRMRPLHLSSEEFLGPRLVRLSLMAPPRWCAEASKTSSEPTCLAFEKTENQNPTSRGEVSPSMICLSIALYVHHWSRVLNWFLSTINHPFYYCSYFCIWFYICFLIFWILFIYLACLRGCKTRLRLPV